MRELGLFAREGPLRQWLDQPGLQSQNGVEGIGLSYDDRLVTEAARIAGNITPPNWHGTIEFSRVVATILAGVGRRSEGFSDEDDDPSDVAERLFRWWSVYTTRSGSIARSPIVIEVSAGPSFGRETRVRLNTEASGKRQYAYRVRRSRGARLQAAASGGRIVRDAASGATETFGTIGGFLVNTWLDEVYAVTAAHVCNGGAGLATPTPVPRAHAFVRANVRRILRALPFASRHRAELCPSYWRSNAQIVAMSMCSATQYPTTSGVDAALHVVANSPSSQRRSVPIANLADVSQVLELSFIGATSGYQRAAVTSYSIWHSYEMEGGFEACIHDCLQVKPATRPYVQQDLSQGGDSGSWLLAKGLKQDFWVGMLTGGDGDRAGIVPATRIVECFSSEIGDQFHAEI